MHVPDDLDYYPETLPDSWKRTWRPVDLDDVLSGQWQAPEPTVGARDDGVGIFYPGKMHTLSSESEGGKTWFALACCIQEIARGNHVVYLDFEDDEGGIVGRMLTLQAQPAHIRECFHYVRPEDPIGTGVNNSDLAELFIDTRPTLAILDGITEALTMHGLNPNDNADIATFGRMLPRRLAGTGAASVALDHVPKDRENRGRYSIGAVHKLNGLDGAALVLENRTPFGMGITGRSTVRIAKDRPGRLRQHALPSHGLHWFADLELTSHPEGFAEAAITKPEEQAFRPTHLMGQIMALIASKGPLSKRLIRAGVKGRNETVDAALDCLILDGFLTERTPHQALREWSE